MTGNPRLREQSPTFCGATTATAPLPTGRSKRAWAAKARPSAATLSDLNNDRAVDLLVTGSGAGAHIFCQPSRGPVQGFAAVCRCRPCRRPWAPWCSTSTKMGGWMWRSPTPAPRASRCGAMCRASALSACRCRSENVTAGWGLTAIDIDNDGWLDLVAAVETPQGPQLRALRNLGPGGL